MKTYFSILKFCLKFLKSPLNTDSTPIPSAFLKDFNGKELRILSSDFPKDQQDLIDMDWAYEAYWAVCWCLSLVDDIKNGGEMCDCNRAISFVINSIVVSY